MKIFMILLLTLLTVSAFTDTARTGIVCKTHQNCGFSARCVQGHCMPVPGTWAGVPPFNCLDCYDYKKCVENRGWCD